jgi:hypothetical protein
VRKSFLNSADDMKWLRDVHLRGLNQKFKSAVVTGNEDCPERVEVFERRDPHVGDKAVVYVRTDDCNLERTGAQGHFRLDGGKRK